ncbi:MAG: MopE-related protein [Pseudomonadota bacterium]|nr:MopE-related protein [Pseudomonadota bacterium]
MLTVLFLALSGCIDKDSSQSTDEGGDSAGGDCESLDAVESCDGVDNDCDGQIDEDVVGAGTWYPDADDDGFGDAAAGAVACDAPAGSIADGTDCDDAAPAAHPGSAEVCDLIDNDCDGLIDADDPDLDGVTWYADIDGDTYGDSAASVSACVQPEGYVAAAGDCDDTNGALHPDALEVCDAADIDEDCDGLADDADDSVDPSGTTPWYADADSDGFGDATRVATACDAPASHVLDATDCADADGAVNPLATEACEDGVDNNCDGTTDEGCGTGPIDPEVCGGANTGDTYNDDSSMGGPGLLVGTPFTPASDMEIGRVEVFTGESSGFNTVAIWTDGGGEELASGSWAMDRENAWQGADLGACVSVRAGTTYWVAWAPINGSQSSWETVGTDVSYSPSFDGGLSWLGPYSGPLKYRLYCCE